MISHYTLNAAVVILVLVFHLALAYMLSKEARDGRGGRLPRRYWPWAIGLILLLDVPVAYLLLVYKSWHPLAADHAIKVAWLPLVLIHANVALFGLGVVIKRMIAGPIRAARAKQRRRAADGSGDVLEPVLVTAAPFGRQLGRRRFLRTGGLALGGIVANSALLAAADPDEEVVEKLTVKIPGLPEELRGTTIALVSDIHSSVFMTRDKMERYVKAVNGLKTDLIVLPGDFVNSKLREVYPFAEAFSGLSAPLGVYGVTGNHDYYTRNIEEVVREVEQAGITLLRNENVAITKNGKTIRLLGVDDDAIWDVKEYLEHGKTERGTTENLLKGVRGAEPSIFLCHKPYPFEEYSRLGFNLMLSGHTHGGQIVLGDAGDRMNISFASLISPYIAGLYKARSNHDSQMYVTRGIGTVGVPLRVNCPPEITLITLV